MKVAKMSAYLVECNPKTGCFDPLVVICDSPIEAALIYIGHNGGEDGEGRPRCEVDIESIKMLGTWGTVLLKEKQDARRIEPAPRNRQ